jgi:hypothetical protein
METTTDQNECPFFAGDDTPCKYSSESGNDRIYEDGTVTQDNGAGYWVTKCPHFQPEFIETFDHSTIRKIVVKEKLIEAVTKCIQLDLLNVSEISAILTICDNAADREIKKREAQNDK